MPKHSGKFNKIHTNALLISQLIYISAWSPAFNIGIKCMNILHIFSHLTAN